MSFESSEQSRSRAVSENFFKKKINPGAGPMNFIKYKKSRKELCLKLKRY